jgi:hypothetical protein
MISFLGHNLNVIIQAGKATPTNDWLAFASWYSVHRFLPEAKVFCSVKPSLEHNLFVWAFRCGARRFHKLDTKVPTLVMKSTCMITGELPNLDDICCGKFKDGAFYKHYPCCPQPQDLNFPIGYQNKCGSFNIDEWKKETPPFQEAARFQTDNMEVTERRIINLWSQMATSYTMFSQ